MTTETILADAALETIWNRANESSGRGGFRVSHYTFARAIEQAALQSPEVQRLREDAARYQWLRASGEQFYDLPVLDSRGHLMPDALDNEIDTAMDQQI